MDSGILARLLRELSLKVSRDELFSEEENQLLALLRECARDLWWEQHPVAKLQQSLQEKHNLPISKEKIAAFLDLLKEHTGRWIETWTRSKGR